VGALFEYGFELVLAYVMNTSMNFSARVEYTLTDGYALTSTRGLAVDAVPEPCTWALMLAGIAVTSLALRRAGHRCLERF
jgi:hypothetical protein